MCFVLVVSLCVCFGLFWRCMCCRFVFGVDVELVLVCDCCLSCVVFVGCVSGLCLFVWCSLV